MRLNINRPEADTASVSEQSAVLTLRDPYTGDPLVDDEGAVTITLIGATSHTGEQKKALLRQRRLKRLASGAAQDAKKENQAAINDACDLLAALTIGWTNLENDAGPIVFSRDAAKQLYVSRPWIREQVDAFVSNLANFGQGLTDDGSDDAAEITVGNSPRGSSTTPAGSSGSDTSPAAAA